jgi:hypothetical protein
VALDLRGRGRVSGRPRGRPRVVANIHVGKPQTLSGERSKDLSTKVRISLALSINCHLQSPFFDYFFANRVIEAAAVKVFATNFPLGSLQLSAWAASAVPQWAMAEGPRKAAKPHPRIKYSYPFVASEHGGGGQCRHHDYPQWNARKAQLDEVGTWG